MAYAIKKGNPNPNRKGKPQSYPKGEKENPLILTLREIKKKKKRNCTFSETNGARGIPLDRHHQHNLVREITKVIIMRYLVYQVYLLLGCPGTYPEYD